MWSFLSRALSKKNLWKAAKAAFWAGAGALGMSQI